MDKLRIAGSLTLEAALESQFDILPTLTALQHTAGFCRDQPEARRPQIQEVISRHLNLPSTKFVLSPSSEWIHGSFNICLPIEILDTKSRKLPRKAILRVALPHAVGEAYAPGAVDEKVRCEAATYVWLERECPTVPIPRLLGAGFPGSRSLSRLETESWLNWTIWHIRGAIAWFQGSTLPSFFAYDRTALQDLGYLLIEYVEDGAMLWTSWNKHRGDPQKRNNLYSSIAKIMLDLSRVPLPRIGSWTMDNEGVISLTNRPFHDLTAFWNRHKIPLNMQRNRISRIFLAYQDARMEHQPNSVLGRDDGISQLSALVGLRAILPQLFNTRLNRGQFVMNFTDMHQSNIFVDEDWNITRLIDLEFAYSCPIELVHVPHWLSGRGVDELYDPDLEEYPILHDQFIEAVADRERATQQTNAFRQRLREDWSSGRIWYSIALGSVNAFPTIFAQHLRPRYFQKWQFETHAWPLAQLWSEDVSGFLDAKVNDLQEYENDVRRVFSEVAESQTCDVEGVGLEPAKAPLDGEDTAELGRDV